MRHSSTIPKRAGYTLTELVASMTAATMLMTGMASAILISSSAFQMDAGSQANKGVAAEIQADLTADLQHALSFSERTANAVTFTVPDRDGDFVPETIRYAWSGTLGDPLTYTYNGGTPVTLAGDVQRFNLTYLTRDMTGAATTPENVLLVVTNSSTPTSEEQERVDLLESWGYTVNLITASSSQASYDSAIATNDVVYVNEDIGSGDVAFKLQDSPIGVVSEEVFLADELGLAQSGQYNDLKDINIVDNTHYITSEFDTGSLRIFTNDQEVYALDGTLAGGLVSLGEYSGRPSLAILDTGAYRYGGGTSTSRRVQLPWGYNPFDFSRLNAAGETILRRSIDWAGEKVAAAAAGDEIQLFAYDIDPTDTYEFHVQDGKWLAEYFTPTLPDGATSWSITRVRFRVREDHEDTTLQLQIRPADGSLKPTTTVLETVSVDWTEFQSHSTHEWFEINFSNVTGLDPTLGYCFVIKQAISPDNDHAARILRDAENSAPNGHYIYTTNSGGSWSDPNAGKDISLEVYGTFTN
ncbi:MAG: hypothetical protein HON53_05135 [Planctomycetaceae bacterium]|jgi:hypothetical protein|nr:hypothetical protein [Planctomycetaceae bacterium]MBT6154025.1 hypothetical protein [Planctomycetaceae bacterium]MBT6485081.1 hypothetical protein [Planctomycetaceae bacterium]MBT6494922.1 hypothetical protein [Planctomycetaceae bacterium]